MHACMYVHTYVCTYTRMHVACVCVCVCVRACMHACMYVCKHVCMQVYMHACMYVCMYVCVHVFACVLMLLHLESICYLCILCIWHSYQWWFIMMKLYKTSYRGSTVIIIALLWLSPLFWHGLSYRRYVVSNCFKYYIWSTSLLLFSFNTAML